MSTSNKPTCNHNGRNNIKCQNLRLGDTMFCYLKSHHPDATVYQKTVDKQYQNYLANTIDHSNFSIQDVVGDGACLYRCFVVHLLYNLSSLKEVDKAFYDDLLNNLNEFFRLKLLDPSIQVESWDENTYKIHIKDLIEQRMIEVNYLFINKLAKMMQSLLKKWLVAHKDLNIEDLGGFTIEDLIQNCHDINVEQYNYLYEIFAGENDFVYVKNDDAASESTSTSTTTSATTEEIGVEVEDENGQYKKLYIPDRWGSTSEIYAFSGVFNSRINIYVIKRFDKKLAEMTDGKKLVNSARIKLYQRVELRTSENTFAKELNLLLVEKKGFSHYQYLEQH